MKKVISVILLGMLLTGCTCKATKKCPLQGTQKMHKEHGCKKSIK